MAFAHASSILWPPGSGPRNDVKRVAAAELYRAPDNTLDMGIVGNVVLHTYKAPVNTLLAPLNLSTVLQQDPAFEVMYSKDNQGRSFVDVRLDVAYVLATVDISDTLPPPTHVPMGPALVPAHSFPPPGHAALGPAVGSMFGGTGAMNLSWQEDRQPFSGLNPFAQPFVPGGAGGVLQPVHAADDWPLQEQDDWQLQEQEQCEESMTFELQLYQESDGSYVPTLANSSSWSADGAGGSGRRKVQAVRTRAAQSGGINSADDINSLLALLPTDTKLRRALQPYIAAGCEPYLVDIAADLGRNITLRLSDKTCVELPLSLDLDAALEQLAAACSDRSGQVQATPTRATRRRKKAQAAPSQAAAGSARPHGSDVRQASFFSDTNRLGVPGSLHRISAMRDRSGCVYGLTYRVGRHVPGVADLLADVLSSMRAAARGHSSSDSSSLVPSIAGQPSNSLLLLGRPGVGKTTLLRDIARLMSTPHSQGGLGMSVVIVDTSNEIAGDCDQPHPCIGNARRMMVPRRDRQAAVMIEAVMNHTPEVVIVDEIATKEEAAACRTIAQRGVLLVSTAHGNNLGDLLRNPDLQGVVGGVKAVTLGDRLAHDTNAGHKTRLERAGGVTFGSLVEILDTNKWRLHPDVAQSVDALLAQSYSTGSGVNDLDMPQQTPAGVDTQLRSRSEPSDSQLLVTFESGRVPATAAWAEGTAAPTYLQLPAPQLQPAWANSGVGQKRGRGQAGFDSPPGWQPQQQQQQQQPWKRAKRQQTPPSKKKARQQQQQYGKARPGRKARRTARRQQQQQY